MGKMEGEKASKQIEFWTGENGQAYLERNPQSVSELDELYLKDYRLTRREMNEEFIGTLDRSSEILEAGANIGLQLAVLKDMGFKNLSGAEINENAVRVGMRLHHFLKLQTGNIFNLPFPDGSFDLAFTSGLLIHINPVELKRALAELHRVSRRYLWGFEYFSDIPQEVVYRGKKELLWKRDFAAAFREQFPALVLVKEKKFQFRDTSSLSQMFLLEKS